MEIRIRRFEISTGGIATISRWFMDGVYQCFGLEDTFREPSTRPQDPAELEAWVKSWKIPGITAIPSGEYDLEITRSPLFSQRASARAGTHLDIYTPQLMQVPAYSGIRIHSGNLPEDTEGCLCPGLAHESGKPRVEDSRKAMEMLLPKIEQVLGLQRVSSPDGRVQEFLRYWAFAYRVVRDPDPVKVIITNEFHPPSLLGVEGVDQ